MAWGQLAMEGAFESVTNQGGDIQSAPVPMRPLWQRTLPWATGLLLATVAGLAAWSLKPADPRPVMRSAHTTLQKTICHYSARHFYHFPCKRGSAPAMAIWLHSSSTKERIVHQDRGEQ